MDRNACAFMFWPKNCLLNFQVSLGVGGKLKNSYYLLCLHFRFNNSLVDFNRPNKNSGVWLEPRTYSSWHSLYSHGWIWGNGNKPIHWITGRSDHFYFMLSVFFVSFFAYPSSCLIMEICRFRFVRRTEHPTYTHVHDGRIGEGWTKEKWLRSVLVGRNEPNLIRQKENLSESEMFFSLFFSLYSSIHAISIFSWSIDCNRCGCGFPLQFPLPYCLIHEW